MWTIIERGSLFALFLTFVFLVPFDFFANIKLLSPPDEKNLSPKIIKKRVRHWLGKI